MTTCTVCHQREATHRLVARSRAVELDPAGNPTLIYADFPNSVACEPCTKDVLQRGWRGNNRLMINIRAGLETAAEQRQLTLNPEAVFDWGFADIGKPRWLVTAEFTDPANFKDGTTQEPAPKVPPPPGERPQRPPRSMPRG